MAEKGRRAAQTAVAVLGFVICSTVLAVELVAISAGLGALVALYVVHAR